MTIRAQLHDGTVLEFPDGTDPSVIDRVAMGHTKPMAEPTLKGLGEQWADVGRGFTRGLKDFEDGSTQLMGKALEAWLPPGPGGISKDWARAENEKNQAKMNAGQSEYSDARLKSGLDVPRLAGNITASLPLAMAAPNTLLGAVGAGGINSAMQPVEDTENYWKEKGKQTAIGGGASVLGYGLTKGLSRLMNPQTSDEVKTLMEAGVRPLPGQILGGTAKSMEEKATSIPLIGDAIKNAQVRANNQFNVAAINKALEPIGESLDKSIPLGREAIDNAATKIGSAYDKVLPKTTFTADQKFVSDVTNLRGLAQNLTQEHAAQFDKILKREVIDKINPNTAMATGETFKKMQSEVGRLSRSYGRSTTADERELGAALKELHSVLRGTLERTSPAEAQTISAINKSYALMDRVEGASSYLGSKQGVFSPNALESAVKAADQSFKKHAFSRGNALMQDLAESGQKVLSPTVPDSGTAGRAMTGLGLLSAALAGTSAVSLPVAVGGGAAALAGMAPYTSMGQSAVAHLLATRPDILRFLGRGLNNLAPAAGAVSSQVGQGLLD
jgi:hypothetical protein